jgi:hypothetical protein
VRVRNVHRRAVDDVEAVGVLLDDLGSVDDELWPRDRWPAMRFDRPLEVGAQGGHGPVRYRVESYEPTRSVRFRFERARGFDGFHEFSLVEGDPPILEYVLEAKMTGTARLSWPLIFRPLHNDLIEDALANASSAPAARSWSRTTRVLRWTLARVRRPRRRR